MTTTTVIIFVLDDQRYALSIHCVETILRAAALARPFEAPDLLFGILNLGGTFIPVINIRKQFGLPGKELQLSDRIIIARTSRYIVGFVADAVEDVAEIAGEPLNASVDIFPEMEKFLAGISKFNGHTVLIYDIDTLFPEQRIKPLADALPQPTEGAL